MTTYFCDGIKEVTLMNGVARLEFFRLQPVGPPSPNREVQGVTELIVALPAPSFLQALSVLERIRDQLVKEGVVKPAAGDAAASQSPASPERSPNFPNP
jgi:uncharacterized protein HemX